MLLSRHSTQQLDIGVTGMEIPSCSGDLLSLPERMLLDVAEPIDARMLEAQRWKALSLQHHEQALHTQQLANPAIAGTSAFADVAFFIKRT